MKISIGQVTSGIDKQKNIDAIEAFAKEAAEAGSALVVFPEFLSTAEQNQANGRSKTRPRFACV